MKGNGDELDGFACVVKQTGGLTAANNRLATGTYGYGGRYM